MQRMSKAIARSHADHPVRFSTVATTPDANTYRLNDSCPQYNVEFIGVGGKWVSYAAAPCQLSPCTVTATEGKVLRRLPAFRGESGQVSGACSPSQQVCRAPQPSCLPQTVDPSPCRKLHAALLRLAGGHPLDGAQQDGSRAEVAQVRPQLTCPPLYVKLSGPNAGRLLKPQREAAVQPGLRSHATGTSIYTVTGPDVVPIHMLHGIALIFHVQSPAALDMTSIIITHMGVTELDPSDRSDLVTTRSARCGTLQNPRPGGLGGPCRRRRRAVPALRPRHPQRVFPHGVRGIRGAAEHVSWRTVVLRSLRMRTISQGIQATTRRACT